MKIFQLFLGLLLFVFVLFASMQFSGQPDGATGIPHEQFGQLLKSGTSQAEMPVVKWLAYLFGLAIIGVFGFGIYIGMLKNGKTGPPANWILFGFFLYMLVYSGMTNSYWSYDPNDPVYFGGFPAPTAWMIYGMWAFPAFFTILYNYFFHSWYLKDEDMERFEELLKENT